MFQDISHISLLRVFLFIYLFCGVFYFVLRAAKANIILLYRCMRLGMIQTPYRFGKERDEEHLLLPYPRSLIKPVSIASFVIFAVELQYILPFLLYTYFLSNYLYREVVCKMIQLL